MWQVGARKQEIPAGENPARQERGVYPQHWAGAGFHLPDRPADVDRYLSRGVELRPVTSPAGRMALPCAA